MTVQEEIDRQKKAEAGRKDVIGPIEQPAGLSKAHTPVYTMHRYFARRPWNVFEYLIKNYSRPGDIVYDPFCGGGVTVVEALRLRRRAIGVDLNPLAVFITRMEVMNGDPASLEEAFNKVELIIKDQIQDLYLTKCEKCKSKKAHALWFLWSQVVECPSCGNAIILGNAKKKGPGRYTCTNKKCKYVFKAGECEHIRDDIVKLYYECPEGHKGTKDVSKRDKDVYKDIENTFTDNFRKSKIIPKDGIPDGDREKDDSLFKKGIKHFYNLFTKRNLMANGLLKKAIMEADLTEIQRDFMLFTFSASLSWTSIMTSEKGHGWQHHAYWIPNIYYEMNVWEMFNRRFSGGNNTVLRGKRYTATEIGNFCSLAKTVADLKGGNTCLLLAQSADNVPFPDQSIDVIITDPPFGGNVQYCELSDFWAVWLKETLGTKGIIDNTYEAIYTRNMGFPTEKSTDHYEDMLFKIFKECHRVLKPDGFMVLTFHNKDIGVWMSLHRAARRAGFRLPTKSENATRGMVYQAPIEQYTQTLHLRATGSMLGDFILTFVRMDEISDIGKVKETLTGDEERGLVEQIKETIEYHGGADENTLMTVLIPYLSEKGLLHRLAHLDIRSLLSESFKLYKGKWYNFDMVEADGRSLRPIDNIPVEQITEELIYGLLKEKKVASLDELVTLLYTNLVNSYRPGVQTINKVINKICKQVQSGRRVRNVYTLKPTAATSAVTQIATLKTHPTLFGDEVSCAAFTHNAIIGHLASVFRNAGYDIHVGETEQKKEPSLKGISRSMVSNIEFGIPNEVFDIIKEIDLIILKGSVILATFEVTTTVETGEKAINVRYRNLFEAVPALGVKAYLVVYDQDYKKAHNMLFTLANIRASLCSKIKIIKVSKLYDTNITDII